MDYYNSVMNPDNVHYSIMHETLALLELKALVLVRLVILIFPKALNKQSIFKYSWIRVESVL